MALERAIESWAVQDGHPQIAHDDVIGVLFQEVQCVDPILRRIHRVPAQPERVIGDRADMWVVIHDQDARHVRARAEMVSDYSIT